jgi:hypothetical protein
MEVDGLGLVRWLLDRLDRMDRPAVISSMAPVHFGRWNEDES